MKPPTHESGIPFRVQMARGGTKARAFQNSQKYTENALRKLAGRDQRYSVGVSYYNGYIAGVKAERERLTGSKWKTARKKR